jgi:hypothetical protein
VVDFEVFMAYMLIENENISLSSRNKFIRTLSLKEGSTIINGMVSVSNWSYLIQTACNYLGCFALAGSLPTSFKASSAAIYNIDITRCPK